MTKVSDLEQQIRGFINKPREQYALLQDNAMWNLLCSCLDTIGDTELAIDAYESYNDHSQEGTMYLLFYGILQALFIQQDAVENLCQALDFTYNHNPQLTFIREIRNDSIGHPTKRGKGKGRAYNFIYRSSLTKEGFNLMTTYPNIWPPRFSYVSIPSLIASQREIVQNILTEVLYKLKKKEAEHRAKYRDKRLQDIFPPTLDYYFQKIFEAIHGSKPMEFGSVHVQYIANHLEKFKELLREREILEAYDSITHLLQLLDYPIAELAAYFDGATSSRINENDAYIFTFFIKEKIQELKDIAQEIDESYEREP